MNFDDIVYNKTNNVIKRTDIFGFISLNPMFCTISLFCDLYFALFDYNCNLENSTRITSQKNIFLFHIFHSIFFSIYFYDIQYTYIPYMFIFDNKNNNIFIFSLFYVSLYYKLYNRNAFGDYHYNFYSFLLTLNIWKSIHIR